MLNFTGSFSAVQYVLISYADSPGSPKQYP